MEELPFGYKMDDEVCKLLVYWSHGCEKNLLENKLIYDTYPGGNSNNHWRLSGKGGRLYNAIVANLKHQYLYGEE